MMSCVPLLCNHQIDFVDKSHCNLATVPDDILRYGRSIDELVLDSNQICALPKVCLLLTDTPNELQEPCCRKETARCSVFFYTQ